MGARIDPYSLVGTTVRERYTIVSFGGVGRHSIVYRAIEAETQRPVALRFLKVRTNLTPSQRTVIVERLRALVQPLTDLAEHSPSLADILDVSALVLSESEGRWMPVLVQPWLEGHTLETVLGSERQSRDAKRALSRAIDLLSPVADALQYAHARGAVHGSLSPRNLFVRGRRSMNPTSIRSSNPNEMRASRDEWTTLQVLDLGIAGVLEALQAKDHPFLASASPLHFFVPAYGAPEQFGPAHGSIGPGVDVFALALVVVELVTGAPPLGDGDDEQLEKAATDPVYRPTPQKHGVTLGPYVEAVLERALAVRPADRYATVASFWEALRAASRVILRANATASPAPPPLPVIDVSADAVAEAENDAPPVAVPKPPPLPDLSMMRSMIHGRTTPPQDYGRAFSPRDFAERDRPTRESAPPPKRESIPPHEFFAKGEGAHDGALGVASATNPLFRADAGRSVAPSAIDAPTPSQRARSKRVRAEAVRGAALTGAFLMGITGASVGTRAADTAHGASSTPLPADVIAAVAAIKAPAAPTFPPCPAGMIRIPGGHFTMGTSTDLAASKPAHDTTLAPYCIDKVEVTVERFASYLDEAAHGKRTSGPTSNTWAGISLHDRKVFDPLCNARDSKGRGNHPVNCIDWKTAAAYCTSRSARLPSEAEWELAARGTDDRRYPWGNEEPSPKRLNACGKECVAWGHAHGVDESTMYDEDDGFPTTAPVGSFPAGASPYGVQDVAGNVWEWTSDWYGTYHADAGGPKVAAAGTERVVRGGAWNSAHADWVRPSFRWHGTPATKSYAIGFRCAE